MTRHRPARTYRAAQDPRIIRNHRKVEAAVTSAAAVNEVAAQSVGLPVPPAQ